jgi:hypothetical protein
MAVRKDFLLAAKSAGQMVALMLLIGEVRFDQKLMTSIRFSYIKKAL